MMYVSKSPLSAKPSSRQAQSVQRRPRPWLAWKGRIVIASIRLDSSQRRTRERELDRFDEDECAFLNHHHMLLPCFGLCLTLDKACRKLTVLGCDVVYFLRCTCGQRFEFDVDCLIARSKKSSPEIERLWEVGAREEARELGKNFSSQLRMIARFSV